VSHAYAITGWENFFFAEVGAAAALIGLLFIAVSINLAKIIELPTLPGRAFEALLVLGMVLFVATFALVPGQSTATFGAETLATATACWVTTMFIQWRSPRDPSVQRSWVISRIVTTQIATVPMVIAGVSLLANHGGGLYWTVAGVLASFLAALTDAWVLLVEIQR
jgi:hypothetical protein